MFGEMEVMEFQEEMGMEMEMNPVTDSQDFL